MKTKTLIHNLIFSHIGRVIRALCKATKSIFHEFKESELTKKNQYRSKVLFGSFRLHYNWCSSSSHVRSIPSPFVDGVISPKKIAHLCLDSTWNSAFATEDLHCCNGEIDKEEAELSSYLRWLEEKGLDGGSDEGEDDVGNEIDQLAELFIANCHEKFRLEKIESYRRYQEMLARST
ncbi:hypothetical protein Nepgr_010041 [Nepenthes gracilis]|uniref:Uncharacterized protein n=1 Tax=Nepenthes gracilis TaxID=150966 RepID=A0AAD3SC86_NEPGR|nr:hypothetical protein Nepgr_010041 [Nepenthes gracilis]